jgi:HsdM N-terminal domain
VLTGELKNRIDRIWDAFWAGGIANPLEVMEQITYLLFIRWLDDPQTALERKATRSKAAVKKPIFPSGSDVDGPVLQRSALVALQEHGAGRDVRPTESRGNLPHRGRGRALRRD